MKKEENNARALRIKLLNKLYPTFWDEGVYFYKSKGIKRRKKLNSEISFQEYRMYRTWKYNRKKQWKKQQ